MSAGPGGGGRARAVIRAPNHLGELVLALPALRAASRRWTTAPLVQVVEGLAPLVEMADLDVDVLRLRGRRRVVREAARLRGHRPDVGVLLTPSFSAALLFALARVRVRRGTATDGRTLLLTEPVDRGPLLEGHRVREYLHLVDRREAPADGDGPDPSPPPPRLEAGDGARAAWRAVAREAGLPDGDGRGPPRVGLVPGSRAPARRWPAERWAELAGRLSDRGWVVPVFGGPEEAGRTARVAAAAPRATDLGGRTGLPALAGGLASCDAIVANDTGPMHVAAALDRPLVVVWGSGDPRQTRPLSPRSRLVGRFDLPCTPCLEATCPRRGEGYVADRARRECLWLVTVDRVEEAVTDLLADEGGEREERRA